MSTQAVYKDNHDPSYPYLSLALLMACPTAAEKPSLLFARVGTLKRLAAG